MFLLKTGGVWMFFSNADRVIGNTLFKAWLILASMRTTWVSTQALEHNAKRYSLFITENPRT